MSKKKKIDTRHLFHAIAHLNIIPMRKKPSDDELMVSQMLFGETCIIVEKKNKHWFKITTTIGNHTAWVRSSQITLIDESKYTKYNTINAIALELCHPIFNDEISKHIVIGSTLPGYDGISCIMPDSKYIYNGQATHASGLDISTDLLCKLARRYLYSPELAGGRTPFGIDAGALIQNIYRFFSVPLPRFPHEQYLYGEIIDFVELCQEGDLVFCEDENGHIHHTGMVVAEKKVIHVYGCVRIDKLDHFGFYNNELRKYTHKLRIIKRIL
jgi:cell wall-associated NlpC family hydrolase